MAGQTQKRHVGDTRIAIAATLTRPDGTAVDLSGLTVKFKMVDSEDGSVKVAETSDNVTVTDEAAGEVQYDPQAADVNTAGTYYAYFTVYEGTNYEHFPVHEGEFVIEIYPDQ